MLPGLIHLYKDAYRGLPRSIWLQALVLLINRSGTMVIPFLTIYLTQHLHYSLAEAGMVMAFFGLGAIAGAYLGGRFSDRIGFYPVQFWALFLSGVGFIVLGQMQGIVHISICVFLMSVIGEAFRPANASAIVFYSTEENRTRSYSLNRLAVNLGWAIGPAIGGLLAGFSYELLFWVDGCTCIVAALFLRWVLKPPAKLAALEQKPVHQQETEAYDSAYRDKTYLWFTFLVLIQAVCFFQLFSIIPVFYKEVIRLSEFQIGLILASNGLVIALVEMVLVHRLNGKRSDLTYIVYGMLLFAISFAALSVSAFPVITVTIAVIALTLGEMLAMPFMNNYWIKRSSAHNRGQYAALHTIAFSMAHVLAPSLGAKAVQGFGYTVWWCLTAAICLAAAFGFRQMQKGGSPFLNKNAR